MPIAQHNDNANLLTEIKGTIDRGRSLSLLTDTIVNGASTRAGLKARIASVVGHADAENFKAKLYNAINVAGWSDSDIAGVTTVAGLQALVPGSLVQQSVLD